MKYYVIQEKESVYNDEGYDLQEGGNPVEIFTDKVKAQEKLLRLEYKRVLKEPLGQFSYDGYPADIDTINAVLGTTIDEEEIRDDYEWKLPYMTFEQFKKFRNSGGK